MNRFLDVFVWLATTLFMMLVMGMFIYLILIVSQ